MGEDEIMLCNCAGIEQVVEEIPTPKSLLKVDDTDAGAEEILTKKVLTEDGKKRRKSHTRKSHKRKKSYKKKRSRKQRKSHRRKSHRKRR